MPSEQDPTLITLEDIQIHVLELVPTYLFLEVFDLTGPYLVEIINCSLQSSSVPSSFKHILVNPICKKPNLNQSDVYFPKILEKAVAEQFASFLEEHYLYVL